MGSEQPGVVEYTVKVRPGRVTEGEKQEKTNGRTQEDSVTDKWQTGHGAGQGV